MPKFVHASTQRVPDINNVKQIKKHSVAFSQRYFKSRLAYCQSEVAQIVFHGCVISRKKKPVPIANKKQKQKFIKKVLTNMTKYGIIEVATNHEEIAQMTSKMKGKLIKRRK